MITTTLCAGPRKCLLLFIYLQAVMQVYIDLAYLLWCSDKVAKGIKINKIIFKQFDKLKIAYKTSIQKLKIL